MNGIVDERGGLYAGDGIVSGAALGAGGAVGGLPDAQLRESEVPDTRTGLQRMGDWLRGLGPKAEAFARESRRLYDLETLHRVSLYDDDAESKSRVDGDGQYFIYGTAAMRGDAGMAVYGRDYARVAVPDLADCPLQLAEGMVDCMQDEEERKGARAELEGIKAAGGDTAESYYAFVGRHVRDGVRRRHAEWKAENERRKAAMDKLAAEEAELKEKMRGFLLKPDKFTGDREFQQRLMKADSREYVSTVRAMDALEELFPVPGGADGREKWFLTPERARRALGALEGDARAREIVLEGVRVRAEEGAVQSGLLSSFAETLASFVGGGVEKGAGLQGKLKELFLEHVAEGREASRALEELRGGKPSQEELMQVYAFLGEVGGVIEAARDKESGSAARVLRGVGAGVGSFMPFAVGGPAGWVAKGLAYLGMQDDSLAQQAVLDKEAGREDAGNWYRSGRNQAMGNFGGMLLGGRLLRGGAGFLEGTAAGRTAGRLAVMGGVKGALARYGAGSAVAAADLGLVIPTAGALGTGALNYASEWLEGMPAVYSHAFEDWQESMARLVDPEAAAEIALQGLIFGGVAGAARESHREAYLNMGGTEEGYVAAKKAHPLNERKFQETLRKELEDDPVGAYNRRMDRRRREVDEELAQEAMEDRAVRAVLLRHLGLYTEELESGKVRIWMEAEMGEDGKVRRGEKYHDVDVEAARKFLGRAVPGAVRQHAAYLRQLLGAKVVRDAFMKEHPGAREDILGHRMRLADFEREARAAEEKIAELTGGDGSKMAAARAAIVPEINRELPLGAVVAQYRDYKRRLETAREKGEIGPDEDPGTAAFVVNVPMPDGTVRPVLRRTVDASLKNILEELGEEARRQYRSIKGDGYSDADIGRDLLELRDWLRGQEAYAGVADRFFGISGELEDMLLHHDAVEGEHARQLDHDVTEAFSMLFDCGLVVDAMEGKVNLPYWVRRMIAPAASAGCRADEIVQLGRALQEALASGEGAFREKVAEMYDRHREMVGDLFKKWHNPTEADFLGAEDESIRQQGELDAAFGRGVTTAPAATERFVDEVREETKAHEREQQEQEDARQRREREAVDDVGEKPGNEDKGKDEAHRERVETYADEKEAEVENAPGATRDEAFSNGFCVLVQAEGFQDVRAGMVDVGRISLSRDVPQFKVGADSKTGVVHPLRGLYRPDHDPIRVWQRADGSLEVISGRHRLAYARESGATRIFCYVYGETPERDARWAKTFDLEQNIRDNQATPLEVALYVRGENAYGRPLSNDEIRDAGIDRTGSRGEAGVQLGRYADDEVITALRNGFPVEDALRVVQFCPGDRDVQREGLRVMRGEPDETGAYNNPGSITEARNVMRRFLEVKRAQKDAAAAGEQGDLFGGLGYGTSLRDAEFNRFLGKYETKRQKEISAERSFLNNLVGKKVSKAMAEKYGIDLNDVEGSLKKKLETLSELYTKWKSPELHPELMEEVRGKFNEVYGGREELPAASLGEAEARFSISNPAYENTFPLSPSRILEGVDRMDRQKRSLLPSVAIGKKGLVSIMKEAKEATGKGRGSYFSNQDWKEFIKSGPSETDLAACSRMSEILDNSFEVASFLDKEGQPVVIRMGECLIDGNLYHVLMESKVKTTGEYYSHVKAYEAKLPGAEGSHQSASFAMSERWSLSLGQGGGISLDTIYELVKFFSEIKVEYDRSYANSSVKPAFDEWALLQSPAVMQFLAGTHAGPEYGLPVVYYRGLKNGVYKDKQKPVTWVAADVNVSLKHARRIDGSLGNVDRYIVHSEKWLELPANRTEAIDGRAFFAKVARNIGGHLTKEDAKRLAELGERYDELHGGKKVEAFRIWDSAAPELVDIARHYEYDSFLAAEDGTWTIGVFSPNQIKSITKNRGTFDAGVSHAHFSLGGEKSAVFGEYEAQGLTYVDPADGKRKFCIDTAGVRLSRGFAMGELSSIAPGGHKDTSLKSLVHYPELWRAYPQLGDMRVRLMRPKAAERAGYFGFYDAHGDGDGQYICINATAVLHREDAGAQLLNTLLHEAQHAIQAHEGHSNGAASMGQRGAQRYLAKAIMQRRQLGVNDEWGKANLAFLQRLLADVNRGEEGAIESVYWLSRGEQEARYAGAMKGKPGENPVEEIARMEGLGVTARAESWMTVPVSRDITELGGLTFGSAGRYAELMHSRLAPVGDYFTDRKEMQIRDAMSRRARELQKLAATGKVTSSEYLLEALQVANTAVNMLPNGYRFALEPYQMWLAEFSKLAGTGDIWGASEVVPMRFWQRVMRQSFMNQAMGLTQDGEIPKRELEFWLKDEAGMRLVDRAGEIVKETRAEVERQMGPKPADAEVDKVAAYERRFYQELNARLDANQEMRDLERAIIKKLGEHKIERVLARLLERVRLRFDDYRKDRTLGRIRRVVNSVYPAPGRDGKPQKGKMDAEHYRKLDDYMRLMEMRRGEFELWMETHYPEDGEVRWEDEPLEKVVSIPLYDRYGERTVKEFTVGEVNSYACFEQMSAERAEAVARAVGEFIATGRNAWDNAQEKLRQQTAAWCEPLFRLTGVLSENDLSQLRKEQGLGLGLAFGAEGNVFAAGDNDVQFFDALRGVRGLVWAGDVAQRLAKADANHNHDNAETQRRLLTVLQGHGCKGPLDAAEFVLDAKEEHDTGIVLVEQEPDFYERESAVYRRQLLGLLQRKVDKKNFHGVAFYHALRVLMEQMGVTPDMRAIVAGGSRPKGMSAAEWQEAKFLVGLEREAMEKFGMRGEDGGRQKERLVFYMNVFTEAERERLADARKRVTERARKALVQWADKRDERVSDLSEAAEAKEESERGSLVLSKAQAAYLVLLHEQADYTEMLRLKGYTDEVVDQLRGYAGDVLDVAYELRDIVNERQPELARYYETVYGMPFPAVENYFRAMFDALPTFEAQDLMEGYGAGAAAGSGKEAVLRTRSASVNRRLDLGLDVFSMYNLVMKEQSVILNYGRIGRDLTALLNYRDGKLNYHDALEKVLDRNGVAKVGEWARAINLIAPQTELATSNAARVLGAMLGVNARSVLSMRAGTNVKQLTAVFNTLGGSDAVSGVDWFRSLFRVLGRHGLITMRDMAARPELSGRFAGWGMGSLRRAVDSRRGKKVGLRSEALNNAGMEALEWEDARSNVLSACVLYDAAYRNMRAAVPEMSPEELDAAAMGEVARALGRKSQPLNFRQKALDATKASIWKMGGMFLGSESINTFHDCVSLARRGGDGWKRAAQVWLMHGMALQVLQAGLDWLIDDKKRHKERTVWGYVFGSLLGPLSGIPFVSQGVQLGIRGLESVFDCKIPVYACSGLLPFTDVQRAWGSVKRDVKVLSGKSKGVSWEDKCLAYNDLMRTGAALVAGGAVFGKGKGAAVAYGSALSASAVGNVLDFIFRVVRTLADDRE